MSNLYKIEFLSNNLNAVSPKVAAIIPSYRDNYDKWREYLLDKHLPSYEHIRNVDNIVFSYNLQNYENDEEVMSEVRNAINKVLELNPTWSAIIQWRSRYNKGKNEPVSMSRVRYDAIRMVDNADYFLYLDDDVVFHDKTGSKYASILKYMDHFKNCGAIMSAGFLGGYTYGDRIKISYNKHIWTNRGLFIRNISDTSDLLVYLDKYLDYPGGFEDLIPILELIRRGYYVGTSFNNNAFHKSRGMDSKQKESSNKSQRYDSNDEICNPDYSMILLRDYLYNEFGLTHKDSKVSSFHKFMTKIYKISYKSNCIDGINAYENTDIYEINIDEEEKGTL